MNFDDILGLIGGFGKFQKTLYVWICLPQIFLAFHMLVSVFTGAVPPHLCRPAVSETGSPATLDLSLLSQAGGPSALSCPPPLNLSDAVAAAGSCRGGWEYSNSTFTSTIVTEWDLVCDSASLNNMSSSVYMFGLLVGAVLFGILADKYGRRIIILINLAIQAVFGVLAAFAPNLYIYTALRFIVGTTISGVIMNAFVLGTEWTSPKQRMLAGIITDYFFGFGYIMLAGVAYLIRDWRKLQLAISAPGFLFIFYIWVLPKSARWLMANDREEEAWALIQKAAQVNGKPLSKDLEMFQGCDTEEKTKAKRTYSFLDLVRTPRMRKQSLIVCYLWFVNMLVYYGLSLNISDFGMNIYLTQMVFGLVEMPARTITLFTLNRSRKISQLAFLAVGGAACLLTIFVPSELSVIKTVLAMIGKFGITASLSIIYVYSAEVFPTVIRQNGIGLGSMCARTGGVLAPMMHLMRSISPQAPMVLCGVCPLLGSALTLLLPETAHKALPDTIEDVEGTRPSEEDGGVKPVVSDTSQRNVNAASSRMDRLAATAQSEMFRNINCPFVKMPDPPTQTSPHHCTQCSAERSLSSLTNICPECGFVFTEHSEEQPRTDPESPSSDRTSTPPQTVERPLSTAQNRPFSPWTMAQIQSLQVQRPSALAIPLRPIYMALQPWDRRWGGPSVQGLFQQLVLGIIAPSIIYNIRVGHRVLLYSNPINLFLGGLGAVFGQVINQLEDVIPNPVRMDVIQSLPTIPITAEHVGIGLECPVCKEDYRLQEMVKQLPCTHLFHSECILPWLTQRNTCPVCRRILNE